MLKIPRLFPDWKILSHFSRFLLSVRTLLTWFSQVFKSSYINPSPAASRVIKRFNQCHCGASLRWRLHKAVWAVLFSITNPKRSTHSRQRPYKTLVGSLLEVFPAFLPKIALSRSLLLSGEHSRSIHTDRLRLSAIMWAATWGPFTLTDCICDCDATFPLMHVCCRLMWISSYESMTPI